MPEISADPSSTDDPRQRQPDIALAQATLGWQPKVSLDEGLRHTIAYFDGLLTGSGKETVDRGPST